MRSFRGARGRLIARDPTLLREFGYLWQERAAIREYDGGLPRHEAELSAWEEVAEGKCANLPRRGVTRHWQPPKPERDDRLPRRAP